MDRTEKILKALLPTASVIYIMMFLFVSLSRIDYPFELEWMEGGSVDHMERIMNGESIYTAPSIEFIPYIYTPLYYYAAIPIAEITGITLLPLRLVSFISTLLIFIVIYFYTWKGTGNKLLGLTASGLFAATFAIGGAWFDLARVDMLYILFMLMAVYILRFHKSSKTYMLAAIIASASFLTKQTAVMVFAPIGLYLLLRERKLSWYFNIIFAFIVILSTVFYTVTTDGWYYFWNFTLPADHWWNFKFLIQYWTDDIIKPFSISVLFIMVLLIRNKENDLNQFFFDLSILIGIVASTWSSRLHYGGYSNVLIPLYLFLSIFSVIAYNNIKYNLESKNSMKWKVGLLHIALLFQFVMLFYSPRYHLPSTEDEKAGWELIEKIKSYHGDVYVAGNVYLSRLAGKQSYAHKLLIRDLSESSTEYSEQIIDEYRNALKSGKFAAVIDYLQLNDSLLNRFYQKEIKIFEGPETFLTKTGYTTRPEYIFIPKK